MAFLLAVGHWERSVELQENHRSNSERLIAPKGGTRGGAIYHLERPARLFADFLAHRFHLMIEKIHSKFIVVLVIRRTLRDLNSQRPVVSSSANLNYLYNYQPADFYNEPGLAFLLGFLSACSKHFAERGRKTERTFLFRGTGWDDWLPLLSAMLLKF